MELLISGPESEKLERSIPEDTILLGSTKEDDCITLNLSSAIQKLEKDEQKQNLIQTIVNTIIPILLLSFSLNLSSFITFPTFCKYYTGYITNSQASNRTDILNSKKANE